MAGRPRSVRAHRSVLDAAVALFAERGIDGTSMDAIARWSSLVSRCRVGSRSRARHFLWKPSWRDAYAIRWGMIRARSAAVRREGFRASSSVISAMTSGDSVSGQSSSRCR
jgi:hypothetical protein